MRLCPTATLVQGALTCSPGAFPSTPAGQQPPRNKRPIRCRGETDEWTFRFRAWQRLGFPVARGRTKRSSLPAQGQDRGHRVLKTPASPSTSRYGADCGSGAGRGTATRHPGPLAQRLVGPWLLRGSPQINQVKYWRLKGLPRKTRTFKRQRKEKPAAVCPTPRLPLALAGHHTNASILARHRCALIPNHTHATAVLARTHITGTAHTLVPPHRPRNSGPPPSSETGNSS